MINVISVPYRGATFLNRNTNYNNRKELVISVPYRGATFLNYKTVKRFRRERLISVPYRGATFLNLNWNYGTFTTTNFRPLSGSYISQSGRLVHYIARYTISVPYRGATFLNRPLTARTEPEKNFRPLSGSYISQYHPRNPMSCLGRIGGLRGKSNFIEIQPFWKVKSSHKSSI